ncbi:HET-domain-containing protein, partial [Lojkania enalia]
MDNSSTGSDAALELAAFWLKRCLSTHELCRPRTISTSEPHLPTRLLDVAADAVHLIDTSTQPGISDPRYIALSHCWGKYPIIRTLKKNYENQLKGIAACSLSQTFKDAVDVTRKLGFRYLWIDSLCIIQDDKADWQTEAATMCDVYRNATLTIAAAHAASGDVGCFEQRDGILQFPFVVEIPRLPDAGMSSSSTLQLLFTAYGRGKGLGGPEPPLYGRAWVLQEQYLSPRMLIFDGTQIRWECLCMHGSERTPLGGMSRHIGHQKAIRSGIMEDSEFFEIPEIEDRDFAALARHQQWCYAVMDYTHRGMTNSSDRLVAIDGIAKALARRTQNEYLVGLWRDHLWIGLLWSIPHTGEFTTTTMGAFNLDENHFIRHKEQIAPSWSWVSVTAPV